jgi:hypothetical protein
VLRCTDRVRLAAAALGVALVAAGSGVGYAAVTRSTGPPPVAVVRTTTPPQRPATSPAAASPTPSASWHTYPAWPGAHQPGRPGVPARLVVPSLRLDVRPTPTGRRGDGRLDVPDSARSVVWWAYGAAPGEPEGTVVLAGHVSWQGHWGRFGSLTRLHPGARVYVDRTDGRRVGYRVTAVREVAKTRLDRLGVFTTAGRPALVLLTCGGRWDAARQSYDDNVVVRAVPTN